jgi:hypothetical protein
MSTTGSSSWCGDDFTAVQLACSNQTLVCQGSGWHANIGGSQRTVLSAAITTAGFAEFLFHCTSQVDLSWSIVDAFFGAAAVMMMMMMMVQQLPESVGCVSSRAWHALDTALAWCH